MQTSSGSGFVVVTAWPVIRKGFRKIQSSIVLRNRFSLAFCAEPTGSAFFAAVENRILRRALHELHQRWAVFALDAFSTCLATLGRPVFDICVHSQSKSGGLSADGGGASFVGESIANATKHVACRSSHATVAVVKATNRYLTGRRRRFCDRRMVQHLQLILTKAARGEGAVWADEEGGNWYQWQRRRTVEESRTQQLATVS